MQVRGWIGVSVRREALHPPRRADLDEGDRNGEPAEGDLGCLIVAALVAACAIVTALIIAVQYMR